MKKITSIIVSLVILLTCAATASAAATDRACEWGENCPSAAFEDLELGTWYHDQVDQMIGAGLMNGMGEKEFAPTEILSRAMFVTILYRATGETAPAGNSEFTDLQAGSWYEDAVLWAEDKGLVIGVDAGIFAPNSPITREQIAVILYRYIAAYDLYIDEINADLSSFKDDKKVSEWSEEAMLWAVSDKIFIGDDMGKLNPTSFAKRCEAAVIMVRFIDNEYASYDAVVTAPEQLKEALTSGGEILVTEDVTVAEPLTVTKDTAITLEGNLNAYVEDARPFNLENNANLTINGGDNTIQVGDYGLVNIVAGTSAQVTLNGGNYVGNTDNGSFIKPRGTEPISVVLQGVTYTDESTNGGWLLDASSHSGELSVTVVGGTYNAYNGITSVENLYMQGVNMTMKHNGILSGHNATLEGCKITVTNEGTDIENHNAPSTAIAAFNNGKVVANNCVLDAKKHTLALYTSGGTIEANGCTFVNGTIAEYHQNGEYPLAEYVILVDGQEPTGILYPNCLDNPCTIH